MSEPTMMHLANKISLLEAQVKLLQERRVKMGQALERQVEWWRDPIHGDPHGIANAVIAALEGVRLAMEGRP